MRISDWSSDVCSSDLSLAYRASLSLPMRRTFPASRRLLAISSRAEVHLQREGLGLDFGEDPSQTADGPVERGAGGLLQIREEAARPRRQVCGEDVALVGGGGVDGKSVVSGKSVLVRVDLGGRRLVKKKKNKFI